MSEESFSETPVNVAIQSLQRQVDQLKRIINKGNHPLSCHSFTYLLDDTSSNGAGNEQELKQEIKELRIANDKAEYRIKMLLRALEQRDKQ